ncbi:MAG TPA: aminotransferase class III-fold pyridoxal phosphate-dependent enzyme [Dongiaceae bacterium]|nr:aminotransferase class III-fold pyridoxal phosphate-dependent enzyme [Dongiaceae bacterium]
MAIGSGLGYRAVPRGMRILAASQRHRERAARALPLGVSDTYRYWGDDQTIYVKRAKGAWLWDIDGNRYIDFRLGRGPIILGHADERVDRAAKRGMEVGGSTALACELEAAVAEMMIEMVPGVELVRFAGSGSEAVATALRVARAQSGRDGFVMVEGAFHGTFDAVLWRAQMENWNPAGDQPPLLTPFGRGIPTAHRDLIGVVPYNDAEALAQLLRREASRIGAVLLEPILGSCCAIAAQVDYLKEVRRLCDEYGIVLIFDEAKTGFRTGKGGGQEYYGVTPDLCTFAKAMGNGYPIAALGGKASVMSLISGFGGVLHGGTFTGHPVALAAAQETLRILRDTDVLRQIADWGNELQEQLSRVFADHDIPHVFTGHPSMFGIMFREEPPSSYRDWATSDYELYDRLARALPDYGILPEPDSREPWFICEAHLSLDPGDIAGTVSDVLTEMRR